MENIKIILVHVLKFQWIAALNKINEDIERNQRSIRNSKIQLEMLKEEDNDPFDVIGLRRAASLAPVAPINFGIELSEPSIDEPPGVVLGRFLGKVRVS